jgi:hypothetical protein
MWRRSPTPTARTTRCAAIQAANSIIYLHKRGCRECWRSDTEPERQLSALCITIACVASLRVKQSCGYTDNRGWRQAGGWVVQNGGLLLFEDVSMSGSGIADSRALRARCRVVSPLHFARCTLHVVFIHPASHSGPSPQSAVPT